MKKIRVFLVLALSVLILSACSMKYETDMDIKADGSMKFAIISGVDKEFITSMMSFGVDGEEETEETEGEGEDIATPEPTEEEIANYFYSGVTNEAESTELAESLGFKVEKYHEGDFYGYKYVAEISHIDTVSSDEAVKFDISKVVDEEVTTPITQQKMFRKQDSTYYATMTFDPNNQGVDQSALGGDSTDSESQAQMAQYLQNLGFEYKFVVTLPNAAIDSNASQKSEDGKTLTWNLGTSQATDINFTFQLGQNEKPIVLPGSEGPDIKMIIIIAAAVVLIVVIILAISSAKKKKAKKVEGEETTTATTEVAAETPAEPAPAVEAPAEPTPAVEAPAEPTPAVEAPAEPAPAVETPTVETPATPVAPVEETPAEVAAPVEAPAPAEAPVEPVPAPVEEVKTPEVETPAVEIPAATPAVETPVSEPVPSTDTTNTQI